MLDLAASYPEIIPEVPRPRCGRNRVDAHGGGEEREQLTLMSIEDLCQRDEQPHHPYGAGGDLRLFPHCLQSKFRNSTVRQNLRAALVNLRQCSLGGIHAGDDRVSAVYRIDPILSVAEQVYDE